MTRSREEAFLYALAAYTAASLFCTLLALLASLALMKLMFAAARFALGAGQVYWIKPLLYDSCGFAAASAMTAAAQYYGAALFRLYFPDRPPLAAAVGFTSVFCGLFFWRGALYSSLGAYAFSGLSVTAAALLGGLSAVFQKEAPLRPSDAAFLGL